MSRDGWRVLGGMTGALEFIVKGPKAITSLVVMETY